MRSLCIIVRHGDYNSIRYGDGTLKTTGKNTVRITANKIGKELSEKGITKIDLAIVSGAIRCVDTFALIVKDFFEKFGIIIERTNISQDYYSTPEESKKWKDLFCGEKSQAYFSDCKEIGEYQTTMKYASNLVNACVDRTVKHINQVYQEGAKTILVVTHGPHDAEIAKKLTGKNYDGLKKGEGRIIAI